MAAIVATWLTTTHADYRERVGDQVDGLMGLTEEVIEEYALALDLQSGSSATMTAALQHAIANNRRLSGLPIAGSSHTDPSGNRSYIR